MDGKWRASSSRRLSSLRPHDQAPLCSKHDPPSLPVPVWSLRSLFRKDLTILRVWFFNASYKMGRKSFFQTLTNSPLRTELPSRGRGHAPTRGQRARVSDAGPHAQTVSFPMKKGLRKGKEFDKTLTSADRVCLKPGERRRCTLPPVRSRDVGPRVPGERRPLCHHEGTRGRSPGSAASSDGHGQGTWSGVEHVPLASASLHLKRPLF